MATRMPGRRSRPPLWSVVAPDDTHRFDAPDPEAAELLRRAARLRDQIDAEDEELGWGWAA